ncbi:dna repair dead helicase rad3/xp-d subfamily member [Holotrichia oblita]|uniref:Dna repair dead helicase rad3/xp-d subfamily member n=1 Tax=Holotrichia oblita TaxID=644536 RepID=A0ACB9TA18_HOLOL|nr:dna repair dead helicase rad3/xp-d subfamily member [Holotrichia oblita]
MSLLHAPDSFDFPFKPYQIQHEFMTKLYEVIESKSLGVFESPTGTGKSLSIICAAIRWLKDHNERERRVVTEEIGLLESKKEELDKEVGDWIKAQAEGVEITRKLNLLKLTNNRIVEYDKKIQTLSDKKKQIKKSKYIKTKIDLAEVEENTNVSQDDEDLVLDDALKNNIKEESSDEEDENKYKPVQVFICSRTHSQLSQFVGEIVKSPFGDSVRVVTLSSRQNFCINPDVYKLKSLTLINEKCLDMQQSKAKVKKADEDGKVTKRSKVTSCKCGYYKQQNIEELRDSILLQVQDIEELVNTSKIIKACPYYASRKAAEDAEVVLVPYNTILHKSTRHANGIKLKNNIIIIDEAHNLLEAISQMYSTEVTYSQLYHSLQQLKNYKAKYSTRFSAPNLLCINQLIFIVSKLLDVLEKDTKKNENDIYSIGNFVLAAEIDNYNMFKLIKFCKDSKIAHKLHGFSVKYPQEANEVKKEVKKGIKNFLSSIERKKNAEQSTTILKEEPKSDTIPANPLLSVMSFLESLTYSYDDGRIMIVNSSDKNHRRLQFLLLNPTENFKDIVKEARAIIVAGGTMKPIDEFRNRLFINAGANPGRVMEFACDHIIPAENILPIIFTKGSSHETLLFNYENRFSMGNTIKSFLIQASKVIPGGIVVFFPSYKYENWIWQQIKDVDFGRTVFREPQKSSGVDQVLEYYAKAIRKPNSTGALLFSVSTVCVYNSLQNYKHVSGGKLSEGLNFSDDLGRCVIVVGMPYANIYAADLKEKNDLSR